MSDQDKDVKADLPVEDEGFIAALARLGKEAGGGIQGLAVAFRARTTTIEGNRTEVTERNLAFDATDIIAFCAGVVAILFAISMMMNWVPVNKLTVSVVTFAALAPALGRLAQALSSARKRTRGKPKEKSVR